MHNLAPVATAAALATLPTAVVDRKAFTAAVNDACLIIATRNSLPILANVRVCGDADTMFVISTDLDMEICTAIPASLDAGFDLTAPGAILKQLLKAAPAADMLAFTAPEWEVLAPGNTNIPGGDALVDFEATKTSLRCLSPGRFPAFMAPPNDAHAFTVDGVSLFELLTTPAFAMSNEETRYYLNGVYLHVPDESNRAAVLRAVATDGHRMARHEIEPPNGTGGMPGVILPRLLVETLLRLMKGKRCPGKVAVTVSTERVRFQFGNITITSKTIQGTFPDYQRVTPHNNHRALVVNAAEASAALAMVSKVASTRGGKAVKLTVTPGNLNLTVTGPETGMATMDIKADASGMGCDHFEIGFNARYLADILDHVSDQATLVFNDAGSPTLIKGDDARLFVLMPMRV